MQVIALYDTEHAAFETMGAQIRRLPQSPAVAPLFSNGLLTHEDNLRDPAGRRMLVGVGRAIARATLFCETNPTACVRLTWTQYPETRPTGVDDERALLDALGLLNSRLANFRLREGNPIGVSATLRGARMYEFLDRLISAALPRIRDFQGLNPNAFDGRGNYSLGLREQLIFPEIDYDKVDKVRGLQVTIVTTAKTDEEGRKLLELLGMPFRKN